jgi:hypothetical protein
MPDLGLGFVRVVPDTAPPAWSIDPRQAFVAQMSLIMPGRTQRKQSNCVSTSMLGIGQ